MRGPLHCTPSPLPITEPGSPTFLYFRALPFSAGATLTLAFVVVEPKFESVTEQCESEPGIVPFDVGIVAGVHEFVIVAAPCFFTKATGMKTGLAPESGTSLIQPMYCPLGTAVASILIGNVTESPAVTCRFCGFVGLRVVADVDVDPGRHR